MSYFEYLTASIRLPVPCPSDLRNGLVPFYIDPNNYKWGDRNARVLYHESIHFWQTLSSGYIANILSDEWCRVEHFEESGEVKPSGKDALAFSERGDASFSPRELTECWARFWDVHSRNPDTIIAEEGLLEEHSRETNVPPDAHHGYSGESYDFLMLHGVDHSTYEVPYRWLIETLVGGPSVELFAGNDEHLKRATASYLGVLVFPAVVHGAFGSPAPVLVFIRCIEELSRNTDMVQEIISKKIPGGRINLDWLNAWTFLNGELLRPVLRKLNMPDFTSGLDVIDRGHLGSHAVYASYLKRFGLLRIKFKLEYEGFEKNVKQGNLDDLDYRYLLSTLPVDDIWVAFGQPGQPNYRAILGSIMQPPMVKYNDTMLYPSSLIEEGSSDMDKYKERVETTWRTGMAELIERVDRFRRAEFAVQNGLPPDAYDS